MSKKEKRTASLTIRLPKSIKERLKDDARKKGFGTTLSDIVNEILYNVYNN